MASLNRVELIGKLVNNPELRFRPSGEAVASFTVEVESENLVGEKTPKTVINSFPIMAWGEVGKLCNKFLHKGCWIYLEASLVTEKTETKISYHDDEFGDFEEDVIRYFATLIATKVEFLEHNSEDDAKVLLAEYEKKRDIQNKIVLPLTQIEARIVWYSLHYGMDKIDSWEEGEKAELKKLADNIEVKVGDITFSGNVILHVTESVLSDINSFLHMLQIDSENALVYSSLGADTIIGNTGVRLSEMFKYYNVMEELIQTTSGLENNHP
jgi:single-stranded DNA-binding protein